jgi:hypothetical protein
MLGEILAEAVNLQKPATPRKLARIDRSVDNSLFCRPGRSFCLTLLEAAH